MAEREYLRRHDFLDFELPKQLMHDWWLWQKLGEAASKCEHIAGVPLKPVVARQMMSVYMTKGVHATTAIEGNTLSEAEVAELVAGKRGTQPPSRDYLEQEVINVLACLAQLDRAIADGTVPPLTLDRLRDVNRTILQNTEHEPQAVPGEFRRHAVAVPGYGAVPHADVEHLTERTMRWINEIVDDNRTPTEAHFGLSVVAAIVAHMYLAWIHPFGDGNGRTARLVEAQVLARAGRVPLPAVNLLSDHYNRTRDRYFNMFNIAREKRDLMPFIRYAVEGLVDGLREQVRMVRTEQLRTTWQNYVHETFDATPNTQARSRQKDLVFALTNRGSAVTRDQIEDLTPDLTRAYVNAGDRMLSRDLNALVRLGLVHRAGRGRYSANVRAVEAWFPPALQPQHTPAQERAKRR